GIAVRAIIANRMTPDFGDLGGPNSLSTLSTPRAAGDSVGPFERNLADSVALPTRERRQVPRLRGGAPCAIYTEVPLLADEVHDLDALHTIGQLLLGSSAG